MVEGNLRKYLVYAIGEILLVVIGILIALQVNNINELKKENELASEYLKNLKLNLESDLAAIESALISLKDSEEAGYYSLGVIEGRIDSTDKERFIRSLIENNRYQMVSPARATYDDLISTGNLKLLKNTILKEALSMYYSPGNAWQLFEERMKDTYWYTVREEIFKHIDPFALKAFYESTLYPVQEPTIKYDDIKIDYSKLRNEPALRNMIVRALALRVRQRKGLENRIFQINEVIEILNKELY